MSQGASVTENQTSEPESRSAWPGRLEAVEAFALFLAKAVRQLHVYPVTSQVCVDAVRACRAYLAAIGADETRLTVTPDALLLHEHPLGGSVFVGHELLQRLRRARVAELTIHRDATARDVTRFCVNLIRCADSADRTMSIAALMAEDGVEAIGIEVASRREVLQVAPSAPAQRDLVAHERRRRDEMLTNNTRTTHFFPPHRGWIRLDPSEAYDVVTLADLAILVDDPNDIAAMLQRLVEEDYADGGTDPRIFERRFSDVASLFAGLEPRLSHVMFAKLAGAVLQLDAEARHHLLKRAILPAVFEGRPDASVLPAFPDTDLAESLCVLLEDETAAMAISALDRLNLPPVRRDAILPLMDEMMRARVDPALGLDPTTVLELDKQARRLTTLESTARRSFVELTDFDFRLDDASRAHIDAVRSGILDTDAIAVEFTCLTNLIAMQPNPEVAAAFVNGAMERAGQLVAAGRWRDLAIALDQLAIVTTSIRERRPEVTALVDAALVSFATPDFAASLMAQHNEGSDCQAVALCVIDALGPAIAPSFLSLLETDTDACSVAVGLMCERASLFAPSLAEEATMCPSGARSHVARVLGHAGASYEDAVGGLVDPRDERTTREALRALSRIGTPRAAEVLGLHARGSHSWLSAASVEALLHFPPEAAALTVRDLLAHRPFVVARPAAASRLIARASQAKAPGLEPVLRDLLSLRYRFWNRALVKVASHASTLLNR